MFYDKRDRCDPYSWHRRPVLFAVIEDGDGPWYERLVFFRTVWRRMSSKTFVIGDRVISRYEYRTELPSASAA